MAFKYQISVYGLADVQEGDRGVVKRLVVRARDYFVEHNLLIEWASMRPSEEKRTDEQHLHRNLQISVLSREVLSPGAKATITNDVEAMGFETPVMQGTTDTRITFRSKEQFRPVDTPIADLHLRSEIEGVNLVTW